MIDVKAQIVVRRFDPTRDAESLRNCLIDHQNFHRCIEPSWPSGDAIVGDYMTYLQTECAVHDGLCLLKSRNEDGALSFEASNPGVNPRGTPYRSRDRGHRQYITATQTC